MISRDAALLHNSTADRPSGAVSQNAHDLATWHSLFFVASGLWPILSMRTFAAVTGPKTDTWLVKTVGALIATVGVATLSASRRDRLTPESVALLNGVSGALGYISFHYARRGRISKIYFLDALGETLIIAAWLRVWFRSRADASLWPRK